MRDPSTSSGPGGRRRQVEAALAGAVADDVIEELVQHAESTYDALRADGLSEHDADRQIAALIAGWRSDPASLRRVVRRAPAVTPPRPATSVLAGVVADAIYGWRLMKGQPGSAAILILTIALGVGTVTTLFSVANSVLLRPLSWAAGDGLMRVIESRGGREGRVPGTMMNGSYLAWSEAPQTIERLAAWSDGTVTLTGAGDATRITLASVTPSLFEVLRARPMRGRTFTEAEGKEGNTRFVILSAGLWEQRFGTRDDVIGQPIVLDGTPYIVVGVMPREFAFPTREVQMWLPMAVAAVDGPNGTKRGQIFRALARLAPGATPAQAAAEATAKALTAPDAGPVGMALFGAKDPIQIAVVDANAAATAEVRPAILVLLIASALLFVTAMANVANMQLARATARHRELMIRAALGAGTARLSRQLLIENALVGVVGAMLGLLLCVALHRILPSLLPAGFPRANDIAIDGRVLAFAGLLAPIVSIVAGVLPLTQARRLDVTRALAEGSLASAGAGRGRLAMARLAIVGSQVAVTSVLVIGAVLLTRSFVARMAADRGYDASNVLTATVPFPAGYTFEQRQQARDRILERLKARPGVTHAAFSTGVPLMSAGGFTSFNFQSPVRAGIEIQAEAIRRTVTPDYFGALGVRLRSGRLLNDGDVVGSPTVVVVNRSFVRRFLDDVPPERAVGLSLGTRAVSGATYDGDVTIAGVTDDLRQDAVDAPDQPEMFVAFAQLAQSTQGASSIAVIRTADDPAAYVEALRSAVREEDDAIALDAVMTLEQRVANSLSRPRVYAVLLGGFAVAALLIAGAGLFGVLSYSVTQRSRELAVRSALGAGSATVVRAAVQPMGVAIVGGVTLGLAVSALVSDQMAPFVFGVSTTDWLSFSVAPIVLLIAAALACMVPARRVAQTDPVVVLREA
jgi:predicted permease